ncbi:mannose-ethanolamine phosphotransferase GPI13 NDAI_0H00320 [Naumovozyma dairenensis CBS 421]|uniref:Uncharacterized protein n=1 Tax=Naumovozyma dairenensis (strain ATCC 10597 / BCRC 20456 / CBS 421 / NBRC 0211 / NRRL Y-12639) TaxID=1071378 RepID=G0WEJ5_NAUDC|nr:hypothetical protein NDAI_0H00320 [Naumovozyma dairenensis CBS 421]CCD26206.1 hypothetical protein NDAI_0H00320 [Naumovozyma dairenensis CBS 421]
MDERSIKRSILSTSADEKRIYKSRIQKFSKSHKLYVLFFISLAILQFIAIAFFIKGFLLTRNVLENVSTLNDYTSILESNPIFNNPSDIAKFDKTVIVVIDALRFDFVIPVDESNPNYNPNYHNNFKVMYDHFNETSSADSSLLLKFIADPPTTTLQRLKGLTTGSLPTFIDAGSNFDGSVIEEDNLIKQMYLNNKTVYFVGDDTWDSLFHPFLSSKSQPFESLNVWDLDTVDNGVISYFEKELISKKNNQKEEKEWDVLIGHMLGMDHVGHKYGPSHFSMKDKQLQLNEFVTKVIDSLDEDTLLVVMGDHGMDHTGNHGGDSQDELESTLFLFSKKQQMWNLDPDNQETLYNVNKLGKHYRQVNQIDLVPTLSLLTGLPIPFNNLGWPIKEIAKNFDEDRFYTKAILNQLERYTHTIGIEPPTQEKKRLLEELWQQAQNDTTLGHDYQIELLQLYRDLWTNFDYYSIATGICLLTISVILLVSVTNLIPSIVVNQMVSEFVPSIIIMTLISNVCFHGVYYVFHQPLFINNYIWGTLFATSIGIILGICIPIFDRYNLKWLFTRVIQDLLSDYWSRIAATFLIIHSLLFTSNSFTIWEDRIVGFLIITFGMLTLYEFVFLPNRQSSNNSGLLTATISENEGTTSGVNASTANSNSLPITRFARLLGGYHSITLIICTRLASLITVCREEQGEYCVPTFTTKNNYSLWCLSLCFLIIFMIPACIKGYYNLSSSYQAAAPIWIDVFLKGVLFVNFLYWAITGFENTIPEWQYDLKIFKLTIARIVTGFSLIASNVGWIMGPLCIKLNVHNTDVKSHQATILGYTNIYGSQFFLLIINSLMSIILFMKPLAQLSLFLMCNQTLSILEIIDLLKLRENIIGPVVLALVSYQQFFTTGHQATIPSIQWDVGFILSDSITFPLTHLSLALNTFGPQIIIALSVALLTLWKQPPDVLKPQTLLGRIVSNCGTLIIYNTILCLSSFIWVTYFRRHLMVWKIFCPRFLFACASLIVTQIVITFGTIAFASERLIRNINDIFWK